MSELCGECGSILAVVAKPGRERPYRGHTCMIPADLEIPTCFNCGAEWMTDLQIELLSQSFEQQLDQQSAQLDSVPPIGSTEK